ncbi:uncharacterized protein yc1106_06931 [Curvularia clavata]|uniref:Uncharacterized protein n=1 Tax=Curvularia clavata TaxID=95742 RepID=A0A9Q9DUB8_CURCL|nr:uncharacterized protein yc1106_06931 [Curvularia clavata]
MPSSTHFGAFLVARDESHGFSIFENDSQKRGFIIVIILSLFATVGMLGLILTLIMLKNRRDRKKKKAKMDADKETAWPGTKGRYQKVDDEEKDGVWSAEMEMDDRGVYNGRGYGESAADVSKEPYRPVK